MTNHSDAIHEITHANNFSADDKSSPNLLNSVGKGFSSGALSIMRGVTGGAENANSSANSILGELALTGLTLGGKAGAEATGKSGSGTQGTPAIEGGKTGGGAKGKPAIDASGNPRSDKNATDGIETGSKSAPGTAGGAAPSDNNCVPGKSDELGQKVHGKQDDALANQLRENLKLNEPSKPDSLESLSRKLSEGLPRTDNTSPGTEKLPDGFKLEERPAPEVKEQEQILTLPNGERLIAYGGRVHGVGLQDKDGNFIKKTGDIVLTSYPAVYVSSYANGATVKRYEGSDNTTVTYPDGTTVSIENGRVKKVSNTKS